MPTSFNWIFSLAVGIIVVTAACSFAAETVDWWQKTIVYQIYPRSFQDSDGDGVGDLQGIISRLDYFNYIYVDTIWLSPIYRSPMIDFGYDVEDFIDIDPVFGTLDDFNELVKQAHARGIRVLMDFIPNHTSNRHKWFVESRKGDDNEYSDYYIWHDGKILDNGTHIIPNNWRSCFTGSAWTWESTRNQFYYHQFDPAQPDLNYRNSRVRRDMKKVLEFWLDRGVDGFRVDAISTLYESADMLQDEPVNVGVPEYSEMYLNHIHTRNLPETYDVVSEWRRLFDQHDAKTGRHTFMVVELYELEKTMRYYSAGADMPFNFQLISVTNDCYATCIRNLINAWLTLMPSDKWPNFVTGNHDRKRVASRKGIEYVNAINVLLLTLPGTASTYYGEELGMTDIDVSFEDTQDPWGKNLGPKLYKTVSRDVCRSPMQWNSSINAGFSAADKTWLPVHPDFVDRNVEVQKALLDSPLSVYRQVAHLRMQQLAFQSRDVTFLPVDGDDVIAYVRFADVTSPAYLVAVNVGKSKWKGVGVKSVAITHREYYRGMVELSTSSNYHHQHHQTLHLTDITLDVGEIVIVRLVNDQQVKENLFSTLLTLLVQLKESTS